MPLIFTVEDMKTPERLERVFQQLRTELGNLSMGVSTATSLSTKPTDINKLASQLGPLLRSQLQATGSNPLNTSILLPQSTDSGADVQFNSIGIGRVPPAVTGIADLSVGLRINAAAPSGHFLRGNGTNYIDGTIALGDLPGSGALTVTAGTAMSGGGSVSLGGSVTLNNAGVTSLAATANQTTVSAATGGVTIGTVQSIGTGSTPQFGGLGLGVALASIGGVLAVHVAANQNFRVSSQTSAAIDVVNDAASLFVTCKLDGNPLLLNTGTGANVGIGVTVPTAVLHLKAGTATANTGPLKFNAGTLLTTPELGTMEFTDDGTTGHLYITRNVATVLTRTMIV